MRFLPGSTVRTLPPYPAHWLPFSMLLFKETSRRCGNPPMCLLCQNRHLPWTLIPILDRSLLRQLYARSLSHSLIAGFYGQLAVKLIISNLARLKDQVPQWHYYICSINGTKLWTHPAPVFESVRWTSQKHLTGLTSTSYFKN